MDASTSCYMHRMFCLELSLPQVQEFMLDLSVVTKREVWWLRSPQGGRIPSVQRKKERSDNKILVINMWVFFYLNLLFLFARDYVFGIGGRYTAV